MGEGEAAGPPEAANGGQAGGPRDEELVTPNRGLNDDLKVTSVGAKEEAASVPTSAPRFSLGSLVWTKITGTPFCSDLFHDLSSTIHHAQAVSGPVSLHLYLDRRFFS
jgi:hypothetical protein